MTKHDSWDDADLSPAAGLPTIPEVTLLRELARGGMGIVYRGRQDFLERDVAVKVLAPELHGESFASRFRREAKLLAGIKHPHIVACYAAGVTPTGQHYLVMELVEGPTLERWIAQNGPAPLTAALRLTGQLASALGHACELGVIHRDVKTSNVLLEAPTGTQLDMRFPFVPKLVDLGLARLVAGSTDLARTAPGSVMGTPATMAPEQFDAPDSVDYRADIYGLGCVLYELLTGAPAFPSQRLTDLVVQKRRSRGPNPCEQVPSLPVEVGELVAAMLAHDPADRPADYRTLRGQLDELAKQVRSNMVTRPSAPARAAKPAPAGNENLLRTAEFEFLAKDHDSVRSGGANFVSRLEAPQPGQQPGQQPETGANAPATGSPPVAERGLVPVPAAVPARKVVTPRVVGARQVVLSSPRAGGRRAVMAGVLLVAMAGVSVPWWRRGEGGLVQPPIGVSDPKPSASDAGGEAERSVHHRPTVELLGLDGPLRRGARLQVRSRAEDVDGDPLQYEWSVEPADAVVLETPAEAATAMRHELLPGDAFTLRLVVSDPADQAELAQRVVVRYPASDLLADFFQPGGAWQSSARTAPVWQRAGHGIVVQAGDETRSAMRPLIGAVWRVAGVIVPEGEGESAEVSTEGGAVDERAAPGTPVTGTPGAPGAARRGPASGRPGTGGAEPRGAEALGPPPEDPEGNGPPPRAPEGPRPEQRPGNRGQGPRGRGPAGRPEPRRPGPNAMAFIEPVARYGQGAIALRVAPQRQLALVCSRSGVDGEHWVLSLRELVRDDGGNGLVLRPLADASVSSLESEGARGAAFTITRRGAELVVEFGFVGRPEKGEYHETLTEAPREVPFRLLARSGRVVFAELEHW
ncbi:MAG: protein kinase [Planctomycetota bacterium]